MDKTWIVQKSQREKETDHKIHNSCRFDCWKPTPYQEVFQKLLKKCYTINIYYYNVTQRSLGDYCKQSRHRGIRNATQ